AELLFRAGEGAYHSLYDRGVLPRTRPLLPTISVGNLAVGGAGKTPFARWLVAELLARGERPALLHGGYAADEPALHEHWHPSVPVYAGRDRARSAAQAAERGASVLVLDDGFQHRRLLRHLDIVLVAAERWSSRPHLLPRGPWREPPSALGRAQVVGVTRKVASAAKAEAVAGELARLAPEALVVRIAVLPDGWKPWGPGAPAAAAPTSPAGVAVCAVADPELFLENARAAGARFQQAIVLRDHHDYAPADLVRIREARGEGVVLTTAKDAVKLAVAAPDLPLLVLEQTVRVEAGAAELSARLEAVLRR
ncbi:MAG TPA: tetraacyldisaccharide 4'-kinase, partial [Longimicrobiales bacterium]